VPTQPYSEPVIPVDGSPARLSSARTVFGYAFVRTRIMSRSPTPPAHGPQGRAEKIRQVVEEFLRRRRSRRPLSPAVIIEQHPDLMPELAGYLRKAQFVGGAADEASRQQWDAAQRRIQQESDESLAGEKSQPGSWCRDTPDAQSAPDSTADRPRQIGNYPLIRWLHKAADSNVYLALDPGLEQEMVITLCDRPLPGGHTEQRRLAEQGNRLAGLRHPNLARVGEVGFYQGRPFLATEHVRGCNLREYAQTHPPEPRRTARLVADLCRAVAAVHAYGILHQDIKPENVIIDEGGRAVLIGLGRALFRNVYHQLAQRNTDNTTPQMAPEQTPVQAADRQSDLRRLGKVLCYLLVGKARFAADSSRELPDRGPRCNSIRSALASRRVPRKLARICLTAMQADPARRFASAQQMSAALQGFLDGRRVWRWIGLAAVLVLLALVTGAGLCLGVF